VTCAQDCAGVEVPPPAPDPPQPSNLGGWVLGAVLLIVLVYEVWAVKTRHPTISQWTRHTFGRHRWWRPFFAAVIGLTLWHLFLGGPW
jgi:hypothetical protein